MTTADREMHISEAELSAMTRDVDAAHHDALPKMQAAVAEWAEQNRDAAPTGTGPSRRTFLLGGGAVIGGLVLAACSSSKSSPTGASGTTTSTGGAGGPSGDLAVAGLAASLENLAVGTYQAGIAAATAGRLGTVPPAVVTFAQTAQMQHRDHAAAWNAILTSAGKPAVTGVDMTVKTGVVDPAFAEVKDVVGLAKLALELENVAAATYLNGIGIIQSNGAIKTAASIQPVEMQHAAILNFVLGQYPVPDSFAKTDGARGPTDQIG